MRKIVFPNRHAGNRCSIITRAEVSEAKFFCIDIGAQKRNSVKYCHLVHEFVSMTRSEESSSPHFLIFKVKASACCLVSRHSVSLGQNYSSNPKTQGVRDTLKCEPGKKEVQTPNVVLLSESRVHTLMREVYTQTKYGYWENRELRMVQTNLEICLSETLVSGDREYVRKDLSP